MQSVLLDRTRSLLHQDKFYWRETARQLGISYSWMTAIAAGRIVNPGVVNLEQFYCQLAQKYPDHPAADLAKVLQDFKEAATITRPEIVEGRVWSRP